MIDWIIGGSIFVLTGVIIVRKILPKKCKPEGCGFCECEREKNCRPHY